MLKRCIGSVIACCIIWNAGAQSTSTKQYIDMYKYAAMQEMKVYKIPASITLGQGILESASGNSKLAKDCNNHFGIKCRKNWTGPHCLADDDAPNECFRGYASAMESYRDHSLFLKENSRYAPLFTYSVTDYKSWATGLKTAGYATNPAYAATLIGVIEKYRLTMYDSIVLLGEDYFSPDTQAQRVIMHGGLASVLAKKGETPESIAKEFELGTWQVYKYNDLKKGEALQPGEIVYLKPKRRKGDTAFHIVTQGESMRGISQDHAIKLKQLYKKNHLKPGQQVKPGERLYLQKKADAAPEITNNPTVTTVGTRNVNNPEKPMPQVKADNSYIYEVQKGENLLQVSLKTKVSVADLKRWNNLGEDALQEGQLLVLKPDVKWKGRDSSATVLPARSEVQKAARYHVVLKGETLYGISKLYNVSVDSIKVWNGLVSNSLKEGQELRVAAVLDREQKKKEADETPNTYQVQAGDTLYSISRKFGISVELLKTLNGLNSNGIQIGQWLKVKK